VDRQRTGGAARRPRAAGDEALEHRPRRGTRFEGGDIAYLLGPYDELLDVLRRDQRAGRV